MRACAALVLVAALSILGGCVDPCSLGVVDATHWSLYRQRPEAEMDVEGTLIELPRPSVSPPGGIWFRFRVGNTFLYPLSGGGRVGELVGKHVVRGKMWPVDIEGPEPFFALFPGIIACVSE
jgi:hypothetical protein